MDSTIAPFVVTPWRSRQELLDVRKAFYSSDPGRRKSAVNKVLAWRSRKPDGLPLLLDSTADIVEVILQDEKNQLTHNAVRLLYATAISRFITGLADTQIELTRDKPAWFPPGKTIQLPLPLLEIRHRIVHRHLPSLAELKSAAQDSLAWLWEWYWSQLDYAFGLANPEQDGTDLESIESIREKLQAILKSYVKERKGEVKSRKKGASKASETAVSTYTLRYGASNTSTPAARTQNQLLQLLVTDKMILPADKKAGSPMSGAFLIWSPFLLACTTSSPPIAPLPVFLARVMGAMNTRPATGPVDADPTREGLCEWATHLLVSAEWQDARAPYGNQLVEDTLMTCFSEPTYWNLKLAAAVLGGEDVPDREQWAAVLRAATSEDAVGEAEAMHVDVNVETSDAVKLVEGVGEGDGLEQKRRRGPRKAVGIAWRSRPIGWRPEGWEDDE